MRFSFESAQPHQIAAIESVCSLFDGHRIGSAIGIPANQTRGLFLPASNNVVLDDGTLLRNLRRAQERNGLAIDDNLKFIQGEAVAIGATNAALPVSFPNFSVEMETGTGKTYVYLRTAFQLFDQNQLRKYVIVVPSIAVKEGVLKCFADAKEHLRALYKHAPVNCYAYDSANLPQVWRFVTSQSIELMVMTLDSFNKAGNVVRSSPDSLPASPLELIRSVRPVLILDEPQNMESDLSVQALIDLAPLCALRYSATHKNPYNIVYRLTPAQAYRDGLVKKIEVYSVTRDRDANLPYVRVLSIQPGKKTITAKLHIQKLKSTGVVAVAAVNCKPGDSLATLSGRMEYDGFTVDEIDRMRGVVRFANGTAIRLGQEVGADRRDIFYAQIKATIEEHFRKQSLVRSKGVKVLTLFFIDRVVNYVGDGKSAGIIQQLFDRAFNELKTQHEDWAAMDPSCVRAAYFAPKKKRGGVIELLDSVEGRSTKEDAAAYELIMRKKEILLQFPTDADSAEVRRDKEACFLFSHTALREGWDNPNVFQICTLNQSVSPMRKRQEIGRGVRLAVNQAGDRVRDDEINTLTVVANESYSAYVKTLQAEITEEYRTEIETRFGKRLEELTDTERAEIAGEYGEGILPPPPKMSSARPARLRKARLLDDDFKALWDRIKDKTRYAVTVDTPALVAAAAKAINEQAIARPTVTLTKAVVNLTDDGVFEALQSAQAQTVIDLAGRYPIPNLADLILQHLRASNPPTRITRKTIVSIWERVAHPELALANPHEWAAIAALAIREVLCDHLVEGVQYIKIGEAYDMQLIQDADAVDLFSRFTMTPDEAVNKTIYDLLPCDSETELRFAKALDARRDVRLFVKLPRWFTVPTPVGDYNPDWAIVVEHTTGGKEGEARLYLVTETKSSTSKGDLRGTEYRKFRCGAAHFGSMQFGRAGALAGVDFKVVTDASEVP